MIIRKLDDPNEWLESDRIIGTAFLNEWNEQEAEEKIRKQAAGEEPRDEEAWGLFDDEGKMRTSFLTSTRDVMYDGNIVPISEVNLVGSLPEARGSGNVRALMTAVLRDFRARGDVFAVLHPFSFAFYRKFGFDLIAKEITQKLPVNELRAYACPLTVRQARSTGDSAALKKLYTDYIRTRNLAPLRTDRDFAYRGNGEYGQPDWFSRGKQSYTYIFSDAEKDRAYLKFVFEPGPNGPFTGDMRVTELIYDSPEAFCSVLGFIYGMRAKIVNVTMELPDHIDLSVMIPECSHAEQTLSGHLMGRVLDVEKVLRLMRQPQGSGSYSVCVLDELLPKNNGTFTVAYQDGKTAAVTRTDGDADIVTRIETFSQMAVGLYGLETACYRPETVINGNKEILKQAFCKKLVRG